jgi:hypothetical protein
MSAFTLQCQTLDLLIGLGMMSVVRTGSSKKAQATSSLSVVVVVVVVVMKMEIIMTTI